MNSQRTSAPSGRALATGALAILGFAQMAGEVFRLPALKGVAAATAASPAPKVFSTVKGLETFSTRFFIEWKDDGDNDHTFEITPERYVKLRGPYNRRNVYGAVLAYAPVLESDPHTLPLVGSVSYYALCGDAPLLRELGITPETSMHSLRVRLETRPGIPRPDLPLQLEPHCR